MANVRTEFSVHDNRGLRTLIAPESEALWVGSPVPIVLDIEAHTRTRLRDGGNPIWFIRLHKHFREKRDPASGVSFAEYVTKRHPDKVEAIPAQTAQSEPDSIGAFKAPWLSASNPRPMPTRTTAHVHFEDFDGHQFERLVFAYHLRTEAWRTLEWYGQTGGDSGRDIWGERQDGSSVCVQCVNRRTWAATKVTHDMDSVVGEHGKPPDSFMVVSGSNISPSIRDKIKAHAKKIGIARCELWSGQEFEERLRNNAESLLKRFVDGEIFPDAPVALRQFANATAFSDHAVIEQLIRVFDRPAFRASFADESAVPDFRQAIGDTIQALNTGIWQTRDGKEIAGLPSRHDLASPAMRAALDEIVTELTGLRSAFERLIRDKEIRPCNCQTTDCPTFFLSPIAVQEMDRRRASIIDQLHALGATGSSRMRKFSNAITITNASNHGIIANNVTVHGTARRGQIIIPGSIATDLKRYNYVEYLIKRLTEFRGIGASYGQKRTNRVNIGAARKILERQLGALPKDLPLDQFETVVSVLQDKIDQTAQGRRQKATNKASYHSFENHPGSA